MALQNQQENDASERVDFTDTRTFLLGLSQIVLFVLGFVLLFWVAAALHIVTPSVLDPSPSSKALSLVFGYVPAILLGGGVPFLIQRRDDVNRLNSKTVVKLAGHLLLFGIYFLLFFYDPVSSFIYAYTYVGCRVLVLVGIFGGSRLRAALA